MPRLYMPKTGRKNVKTKAQAVKTKAQAVPPSSRPGWGPRWMGELTLEGPSGEL